MNSAQRGKIKLFMEDANMVSAVYGLLQHSFLKRREKDTNYLAAQTLAVQFLEDAWRELENIKNQRTEQKELSTHPGL